MTIVSIPLWFDYNITITKQFSVNSQSGLNSTMVRLQHIKVKDDTSINAESLNSTMVRLQQKLKPFEVESLVNRLNSTMVRLQLFDVIMNF